MRGDHFAALVDAMESYSITGRSEDSQKVMSIQEKTNFPMSASKTQRLRWNEAFYSRWKSRIKFEIRGRV